MTTIKKVTLNKAALMMKKVKDNITTLQFFRNNIIHPIDAISAKQPESVRSQIIDKVQLAKKVNQELLDSINVFCDIKTQIIKSNVESGLHEVLCQMDMLKATKKHYELITAAPRVVQEYSNSRGSTALLLLEVVINDEKEFSNIIENIITDITRQDSKTNFVNAIIEIPENNKDNVTSEITKITKELNLLEDKKYEINNTYKIEISIPDTLYNLFGI